MKYRQFLMKAAVIFVSLLIIPLSTINAQDINQDDGVYYSDEFHFVDLTNCIIPEGTTKISLDPQGSLSNNYNFSDWDKDSNNKAFSYDILYFFPMLQHNYIMENYATELDEDFGYPYIAELDDITYPLEKYPDPSSIQQVHHFRFKITQDIESTSKIMGSWYGYGSKIKQITMYVWTPIVGTIGYWVKASETSNANETTALSFQYEEDYPLTEGNYIDFCVVLTPSFGEKCSLFTDFVNLKVLGDGYATEGTAQSPIINPVNISTWEIANWKDYQPDQTEIIYQIFYENSTGDLEVVDNRYISNNENGFRNGPIDLKDVPKDYNLSIQATLTTEDLSTSPEVYSWGITWQREETLWKDMFTTDLRAPKEYQENIRFHDGDVILQPSVYDWPMFGQNAENTRTIEGAGPGASNSNLAWYSVDEVGRDYRNGILKDGKLFIGNYEGKRLYMYDAQADTGQYESNPKIKESSEFSYKMVNSPAATDEDTIIVATGHSQGGGGINNVVYALDDITLAEQWKFEYKSVDSENPSICYDASPVVTEDKIFLTSWSGDSSIWDSVWELLNFSSGNNKLICLSINGNYQWSLDLPAGSFSTPAVSENLVIVGCENLFGSSVYAVNMNGDIIWDKNLGPVGKASPAIYKDKVYVVSKKLTGISFKANTQLTALRLSDGDVVWNATVGDLVADDYSYAGYNTPCIVDDTVYIASPDGKLSTYHATSGENIWTDDIYVKGILSPYLQSSPAHADGYIYIGTPSGYIHCYDTDGEFQWKKSTIENSAVHASPIIADGLVYYYGDNGVLYARGKLQTPEGQQITGSMVSIPIYLPDSETLTWDQFFADTTVNDGTITFSILDENYNLLATNIENESNLDITALENKDAIRLKAEFKTNTDGEAILHWWCTTFKAVEDTNNLTIFYDNSYQTEGIPPNCTIDVRNYNIGIINTSAKFKLEYRNESDVLKTSEWISTNCTGVNESTERETISVNLSDHNFTENMTYIQIRFSIKDTQNRTSYSEWHTFPQQEYPDKSKPEFYLDTFTPSSYYISTPTPVCTITAKDTGTEGNISGINVKSATFEIKYHDQDGDQTGTFNASCTGSNGTINIVTLTADIADLSISDNITNIYEIQFSISDMSQNSNQSGWIELEIDDEKPTSTISNADELLVSYNTTPVHIEVEATDDMSGIKNVKLLYRKIDQTGWSQFQSEKTTPPYEWDFIIGTDDGGEYELISIATDKADNEEEYPTSGEVLFIYDPNPPDKPSFASEYRFTDDNADEDVIPTFTDVTFEDDYRLYSIEYRMNFEGTNEWTTIHEGPINVKTLTPSWQLTEEQWNQMNEDITYYIYFRVKDVLGNIYLTENSNQAMKVVKDFIVESLYVPDLSDFENWQWNNEYIIRVHVNESEVSSIRLWYNYSKENISEMNWSIYGEDISNGSFEWKFNPEEGEGYYSFYIQVWDNQGQTYESEPQTFYVSLFPIMELLISIVLAFVLIIVSIMIFKKIKKGKNDNIL